MSTTFDAGWNIINFQWWMPVWMHHLYPKLPAEYVTQTTTADSDSGDAIAVQGIRANTARAQVDRPLTSYVCCSHTCVRSFPVWTDFWISIPLAVVITLVRLFLCDPIATRIVVRRLGLSPTSLRARNDHESDPKKRIPKWVLNEIDGFAQDMLIVRRTATRSDDVR
jgi:hypothetical protein